MRTLVLGFSFAVILSSAASGIELRIPQTEGASDSDVEIPLFLFREEDDVAAIGAEIQFVTPLRVPANEDGTPKCALNSREIGLSGGFDFVPLGCVGDACSGVRFAAESDPAISRDIVLGRCTIAIAADTAPGFYELPLLNGTAINGAGQEVMPTLVSEGVSIPELPRRAAVIVTSTEGPQGGSAHFDVILDTTVAARIERVGVNIFTDPLTKVPFDPKTRQAFCEINPAIQKDASTFTGNESGDVSAQVNGTIKPIPTGSVLFTCPIEISPDAPVGAYPLLCFEADAFDPVGGFIPTDCVSGVLDVLPPLSGTPTATPTGTATAEPTATHTPTHGASSGSGCSVSGRASDAGPIWLLSMTLAVLGLLRGMASRGRGETVRAPEHRPSSL